MVVHQNVVSKIMHKNVQLSYNSWQEQKYARPETYLAILTQSYSQKFAITNHCALCSVRLASEKKFVKIEMENFMQRNEQIDSQPYLQLNWNRLQESTSESTESTESFQESD